MSIRRRGPLSVGEGVYGFELVMLNGEPDGAGPASSNLRERRPVVEFLDQELLPDRRRVDDFAGHAVRQRRAGRHTNVEFDARHRAAGPDGHLRRKSPAPHHPGPFEQGCAVTQCLPGGRVCPVLRDLREFEQLVGGRHDVCDLGGGAGFEQGQRTDQHTGMRIERHGLAEFGSATRAPIHFFRMRWVSTGSARGGSNGRSL